MRPKRVSDTFEAAQRGVDGDAQALDHATATDGDGLEAGRAEGVEVLLQDGNGKDVGQIALVPLHYQGKFAGVAAHTLELIGKLAEVLDVLLELAGLRVRHEDDAVGALQDGDARLLVEHLAGNRVELEAHLEAVDAAEVEGQQIEVQRALGLGVNRDHVADVARIDGFMDEMQVGGFAAQT